MGIKGLDKFIKENTFYAVSKCQLSDLSGSTVVIDIGCLVYKYILHSEDRFMNLFKSIFRKFEKYNINPIFVFDGKAPEIKKNTITKRRKRVKSAEEQLEILASDIKKVRSSTDLTELSELQDKYLQNIQLDNNCHQVICEDISNVIQDLTTKNKKKSLHFKSKHVEAIKKYLDLKNAAYIHVYNKEADIICSQLVNSGIASYCITDDTDMFPYGCNYVIRNIDYRTETMFIYDRKQILLELGINNIQFIDLCILLGSDYIPRTVGIKPTNILYLIKKYKNIENIKKHIDIINNDTLITKNIYMNTMEKYLSVRKLFNCIINISDIKINNNDIQPYYNCNYYNPNYIYVM